MNVDLKFIENHFIFDNDNFLIMSVNHHTSYKLCSLKELKNPKYGLWERIKRIIHQKLTLCSSPAILAEQTPHYDNLLLVLAYISSCTSISDLEIWEQRFKSKYHL